MPGSSDASECSVTDMQKGKKYRYRVCAQNRQGKGHYVEFADLILAVDPPTAPDPPRNVNYSNVKKESVNIGWSIPKFDGGSKITGTSSYRIYLDNNECTVILNFYYAVNLSLSDNLLSAKFLK